MFKLAELLAVTACRLFVATKARSDTPILPGVVQVGPLTSVPVLLLGEESSAIVPPLSSKCQLATKPARTSPELEGVAAACVELPLSPAAFTPETRSEERRVGKGVGCGGQR